MQIALVAGLLILISATYVAQAILIASVLGDIVAGEIPEPFAPLAWLLALTAVRAVLIAGREITSARCGLVIRARLRDQLIGHVAGLGARWAGQERAGAVTTTIVAGVESLDAYYSRYLPQLIVVATVPLTLVVWLFSVSVPAAATLAIAVTGAVVIPRFWDARLLATGRNRWDETAALSSDYLEATRAIPLLRMFGAGERIGHELSRRSGRLYKLTMTQMRVSLIESAISATALHLGLVLTLLAAVLAVLSGNASSSAIFLFLLCARECFRPLADLSREWHAGYRGLSAIDGIDQILSATPAVHDTGARTTPARARPSLSFEQVSFTYDGSTGVRDLSFACAPGETLGLTGPSGAGKSTIARLLERQYDPSRGHIVLDGTSLHDFTLEALHASVTVVGQEVFLFHGSVDTNVRLARPDASDADIRAALFAADADDFVDALPDGIHTMLGEEGARLSGGQRQRIAIARAVVAATPLIVFDEATSALDIDTEERILTRLRRHLHRSTCVIIAHRPSALQAADSIVAIEAGQITTSVLREGSGG